MCYTIYRGIRRTVIGRCIKVYNIDELRSLFFGSYFSEKSRYYIKGFGLGIGHCLYNVVRFIPNIFFV